LSKPKRYVIRNAAGDELVCPTLSDLHALYTQGFLADDDLIRAEGTFRWIPAGSFPAFSGVRERRADPRRMTLLLAAAAALVGGAALLAVRFKG
jgi:hypothetical protein